jgi:hypothetical protein
MPKIGNQTEGTRQPLWIESLDKRKARLLIRCAAWIVTVLAGFVQAWAVRFYLTEDGNAYLQIASAYLHQDYANAINAWWSPMYSWLIAVVLGIFRPSGYWETTSLHLLNIAALLASLFCFEFFFVAFLAFLKHSRKTQDEPLLSEASWWLLGYGLFFSTTLLVITLQPTTPDLWVCVVSYLAVGILLRIALQPERWPYFAAFGFVLGLAYLTKSFYFPLSFVFLGAAWFAGGTPRKNVPRVLLALVVFVLVAGPFVYALSKSKHRFTFGDVGKIGYAITVNPIQGFPYWHPDNQSGVRTHPPRELLSSPRVFEFATPVKGTYPLTDVSYWMEGATPHFTLHGQLRILRQSAGTFFVIFFLQIEFAVGFFALLICQERRRECISAIARLWPLWLPPAVACLAYSIVLVEERYIAPFLVFLWLAAFAGAVRVPSIVSRRTAIAVVLGFLCVTGIKAAKYFVSDLFALPHQRNVYWDVAQNLANIGVKPGDKAALIASKAGVHWARLANLQIVSELPLGQDEIFWNADRATQERVFAAFASTGSRVVVVKDPPPGAPKDIWSPLGDTSYYVHILPGNP